jgi:hypothetical protein
MARVLEQEPSVIRRWPHHQQEEDMNLTTSKTQSIGRVVAAVAVTGILVMATGGPLSADSNDSGSAAGPVGTWAVQVTVRDCASNAPLGPPFNSLVTQHRGGTISESTASRAFAPGQRTSGHGIWTLQGRHTFGQRMIALIVFDTPPNVPGAPGFDPAKPVSPGFFAGWQTISHTARIRGDQLTSAGTNEFFRADGTSYRTGCSTAVGQRFE